MTSSSEALELAVKIRETNSPVLLAQAAASGHAYLIRLAAEHPGTPPEVLRELEGLQRRHVLKLLAENPSTPEDVIVKMAQRESPGYKDSNGFDGLLDYSLAKHPNLGWRGMIALISEWGHKDMEIVAAIVRRKDATSQVLEYALRVVNTDLEIVPWVLANPSLDEAAAQKICYQQGLFMGLRLRYEDHHDWEAIKAISLTWERTIGELIEAAELVRR